MGLACEDWSPVSHDETNRQCVLFALLLGPHHEYLGAEHEGPSLNGHPSSNFYTFRAFCPPHLQPFAFPALPPEIHVAIMEAHKQKSHHVAYDPHIFSRLRGENALKLCVSHLIHSRNCIRRRGLACLDVRLQNKRSLLLRLNPQLLLLHA